MSAPTKKKSENVDALKQMMRFAIQVEQCGEANLTAKFWKGQHHGPGAPVLAAARGDQSTSMAYKQSRFGAFEAKTI